MRVPSKLSALTLCLTSVALATRRQRARRKRLFFRRRHGPQQPARLRLGRFACSPTSSSEKKAVAWRTSRTRPELASRCDDKGLQSVIVELSGGQKLTTKFGPHPRAAPATDHFWSVQWVVPADYPTGSLVYKVVATDTQGRSQTWEPFKRGADATHRHRRRSGTCETIETIVVAVSYTRRTAHHVGPRAVGVVAPIHAPAPLQHRSRPRSGRKCHGRSRPPVTSDG